MFKGGLATYHGTITEQAVAKLAKQSNHRSKIVQNFHSSTKAYKRSGKHTENRIHYDEKIKALVNHLTSENLFTQHEGQCFSAVYAPAAALQEYFGEVSTWAEQKIDAWLQNIIIGTNPQCVMMSGKPVT